MQPLINGTHADWRNEIGKEPVPIFNMLVVEGHRAMSFSSEAATVEEAEAAAIAAFVQRFPNRLPDYAPPSVANNTLES